MKKAMYIAINSIPVILMVGLIPLIQNDYVLSIAYLMIIAISLSIKREAKDISVFLFGLVALTIFEAIFISTGVETFSRRTLFDLMPIWLPILWGYGFVAIKRGVLAL